MPHTQNLVGDEIRRAEDLPVSEVRSIDYATRERSKVVPPEESGSDSRVLSPDNHGTATPQSSPIIAKGEVQVSADDTDNASQHPPSLREPRYKSRKRDRASIKTATTLEDETYKKDAMHSSENKLVLEKYTMYKTESRLYVIASNQSDSRYRILKIDRHYSPTDVQHELHITEDATIYSKQEISDLLKMIEEGNKNTGGIQKVLSLFYGIVGFVRFTAGWYVVLIKQRAAVALIGGHYIYHCEESVTIPVSNNAKPEKLSQETKLYNAFQQVDISKNFYFSYSYDLTSTLQSNLTQLTPTYSAYAPSPSVAQPVWVADHAFHEPKATHKTEAGQSPTPRSAWGFNDKFVWNHYLLEAAFADGISDKKERSCWVLPLIHGFVDQAKLSVFGRTVYVTLIARRSRYFAGARFLKRGVNDEGNVANDVETEQIVSEALTTSFYAYKSAHDGSRKPTAVPRYTSYVQHRGSIPLSWQQDTSTSSLKPPIHLHLIDPYHSAAALHFDDLFARYGSPIIALNLIKRKEHEPRESKLIEPYKECIDYLNQFLPSAKKISYIPFDMSAAYKNRTVDVIGVLEDIAEEVLESTKFFHSGPESAALAFTEDGMPNPDYRSAPLLQEGVCRTNCIDCLDRTNAAQFVIAKAAFGHQLHALGLLANPHLTYDNDAVNMLTEMYHDHGDTIALQYGGSHLVNTMNTYRKINQWTSHSRDMIEGIKRFYANVALDQDKQNSINLFLGIDIQNAILAAPSNPAVALAQKVTPLLTTSISTTGLLDVGSAPSVVDKALEAGDVEKKDIAAELSSEFGDHARRRDYRFWFTREYIERHLELAELLEKMEESAEDDGNYWLEYYRPKLFTQLERHFAYKVNSTARYNPKMNGQDKYLQDYNDLSPFKDRPLVPHSAPRLGVGVRRWMSVHKKASRPASAAKNAAVGNAEEQDASAEDSTSLPPINTTEGLAMRLLKPRVLPAEAAEYASYVDQFRNLNLSNELHYESSAGDMQMYEQAIRMASGRESATNLTSVDRATEELYEKHCSSLKHYRTYGANFHQDNASLSGRDGEDLSPL